VPFFLYFSMVSGTLSNNFGFFRRYTASMFTRQSVSASFTSIFCGASSPALSLPSASLPASPSSDESSAELSSSLVCLASAFRPLAGSAASSDSESLTGAAMVLRGAAAPRLRRLVASSAAFALAAAFSLASALRFASSSAAFCLASFAARSAGAMESREAVAREGGARSGAQCQVPCGRPRAARPQAT